MKSLTIKINPAIAILGSFIAVVVLSGGVLAAIPSIQGVINGCYSNQNGQLKIIDQADICSAGQTNLQWDRGVIAYAHITNATKSDGTLELIIPAGQSRNLSMVASNPGIGLFACLDLELSLEDKVRFVSFTPSVGEIDPQVLVKNKSQDENEGLAAYCTPEADILIVGGGSAYISVY